MADEAADAPLPREQIGGDSIWRTPRWQVALILLINTATIPLIAAIIYFQMQLGPGFSVYEAGMGIFNAQIYLLAFWMAFGGWPKRWRRLGTTILTMTYGLAFGAAACFGYYLAGYFAFNDGSEWRLFRLMLFGTPLIFAFIIWVIHTLLLFPQWYWGVVVGFRQVTPLAPRPTRQLGVIHYLTLMFFVAIPLGVVRLLSNADEELTGIQVAKALYPFVSLLVTLAPISFCLLAPRLSVLMLTLSFGWFALGVICLILPPLVSGTNFGPVMMIGTGLATTLNLILWRSLGIRWLPHGPVVAQGEPFKTSEGPDWNS